MNTISFLGNIGCGKSTWARCLAKRGFAIFLENLSAHQFLADYWSRKINPFHTQIEFYVLWLKQYSQSYKNGGGILDSSIISHHNIFTKKMLENQIISQQEFDVCDAFYNSVFDVICCRNVYLYCELDECYRRATVRSRANEMHDKEFLEEIHLRLQNIYKENNKNFTFIDITNLDSGRKEDVDHVLSILKKENVI